MGAERLADIDNVREAGATLLTSGQPTKEQLAVVARSGVEVVINLAPHDAPNAREDEAGCVTAFLGLYRVIRLGWVTEEAFALMRTVWEPDAVWSRFIAAAIEKHRG
jgi:hypothetical protein